MYYGFIVAIGKTSVLQSEVESSNLSVSTTFAFPPFDNPPSGD